MEEIGEGMTGNVSAESERDPDLTGTAVVLRKIALRGGMEERSERWAGVKER